MMSRIRGWLVVGIVVALAVIWSGAVTTSVVSADEPTAEAEARLTFEQPTANNDTVSLLVRLTADDGQPIARAQVEFFVSPDFFGERPVSLPTAITNADGLASLKYVPTWDGAHKVTALFAGNSDYQPGAVTAVMTVSGTVAAPLSEGESLHVVRQWAAPAVTLGAVIVWLLIVGVLVRVGWGVWRERDRGEEIIGLPRAAVGRFPAGTHR